MRTKHTQPTKMKLRITPGALLLLPALLCEQGTLFFATVLAATLHECGHLLAAKLLHIRLRALEIDLMGAKLYPSGLFPSYRAEVLLAAAGPLASILPAIPLFFFNTPFATGLRVATLAFALFNLFPIDGFDGGRILSGLVGAKWGLKTMQRVLFVSTYLSLLFLFAFSSCLLLRYGESATLAVLSASLFAKLLLSVDSSHQKSSI